MEKKWMKRSRLGIVMTAFWFILGTFLAAAALEMFLIPNRLIDGGIVGIAMIASHFLGASSLPYLLILLNLPFILLAFFRIRKSFLLYMLAATLLFAGFLVALPPLLPPFFGDWLEIIVFGGGLLGIGCGLVIRHGGCLDGAEILAIITNKRWGFTVGQVVLGFNIFVFFAYGWLFSDWHLALRSLMTYFVAFQMIDLVIVGLNELKSVMIISSRPADIRRVILEKLGLGLTILHGKGGYSGDKKDILVVIVERLDLALLKELVIEEDPKAFMAIENLHEVVYGEQHDTTKRKRSQHTLS